MGEDLDNVVPTRGYEMPPVVALGGSAGSIAALQEFFRAMSADSGMVFVVILHLSPEHESTLAQVLGRCTTMPVVQAADGEKLDANSVYVIPPGKHLTSIDGHLRLTDLEPVRGRRVAVDLFFRTLADTHGAHAAAIVLSGADGDGALGIKRIKERGGLTIAQDPGEAEYDSMPRAAIGTGMVDWVLPVSQIPARLLEYRDLEKRLKLPAEDGPQPASAPLVGAEDTERALREVLSFLRTRTARDFSYYKRATIVRRISRRMQVNGILDVPAYLLFLRTHPGEAGALLQDLLISVTNFFRDRDAFAVLEAQIPALFAGKKTGEAVRVWVAGCATGEEAYSIAILLSEYAQKLEFSPAIQIFASDLDEHVIAAGRDASYPDAITADVSDERLRRFFIREASGYRVRREVRELVLFAPHDLLKDSPFSRLDFVSCRNLLIYLDREAQTRALELFHFALKPGGLLFLGSAESVEEGSDLFSVIDKKARLYSRSAVARPIVPLPVGPGTLARTLEAHAARNAGPIVAGRGFMPNREGSAGGLNKPDAATGLAWSEVHFEAIEKLAPPSLLINEQHEILHLSENAGRFLQLGGGDPTRDLLKLVPASVRLEMRTGLFRARQSGNAVQLPRLPVELEGASKSVSIRIVPLTGCLLVVFEPGDASVPAAASSEAKSDSLEHHLEAELEQTKRALRGTVEQYAISTEELKANNEELQAMNEELRSATEELETGREELQSINEELSTVNAELKSKVDALAHANSDLHNLMSATAIPTIFLDREFRIARYTPSAVTLFNLIPSDVGRPLADLQHRLDYPALIEDVARVLETLIPIEHEISDASDRWFLARVLPYRTPEDSIGGVVLTLVDITRRKQAEEAKLQLVAELDSQVRKFNAIIESGSDFIYTFDLEGRFSSANRALLEVLGETRESIVGKNFHDLQYPPELAARLQEQIEEVIATGQRVRGETSVATRSGRRDYEYIFAPLYGDSSELNAVCGVTRDMTEHKATQEALRQSEERLRLVLENAREYAIFSTDLDRRITSWNAGAERLTGHTESEAIGQLADIIFTEEDCANGIPGKETGTALAEGRAADERWHVRKDGSRFWGSGVMMAMHDTKGEAFGFVKIFRDHTAAREARETLERSQADLWEALQEMERAREQAEAAKKAKDHFLAVLSHELRTPLTPVLMAVAALSSEPDLPAMAKDALEMIVRNVKLEAGFIDDLLDVTRIERGKLELCFDAVDLHETVQRAVEVTATDFEGKEQTLTVELAATAHSLRGDATRLQQVFWNLLKNASKFSPVGSAIRLRTWNEDDRICASVSDAGIGFSPEHVQRIFDPFAQASGEVTQRFGGLGLGLAIAKATVDGHGGTLHAESPGRDQGATFTVTLPLNPPSDVSKS